MGTQLIISDDILWGKLVKSWATGKNYIAPTRPAPPVPLTRDELLAQAADIGLEVTFPDGMVGLTVVQYSSQTVVLKLPPGDMVNATEAELKQEASVYPLPRFYEDFYREPLPSLTVPERLDLHAARIGDYSVRNCG